MSVTDPAERYCPACERQLDVAMCPECAIPGVSRSAVFSAWSDVEPGDLIAGRYRIERLLGRGGMGAVYEATQLSVNRRVALKVVLRELLTRPRLVTRFYREARVASQLDHPNIVRIFDFGIDGETSTPFIAMELLEGRTLEAVLEREGRLSERRAASLLLPVCRALDEAHAMGLVHRDLKPDNIHVRVQRDGREEVKLLDFGIAKLLNDAEDLTRTGMTVGTPHYMAPEQIEGDPVDYRADLYAIGCLLVQAVSGRPPFDASDKMAVLLAHLADPPPPLPDRLCDGRPPSRELVRLVASLLAKRPEDRPPSTADVVRALEGLAREKPLPRPLVREDSVLIGMHKKGGLRNTAGTVMLDEESSQLIANLVIPKEESPRRRDWIAPVAIIAVAVALLVAYLLLDHSIPQR